MANQAYAPIDTERIDLLIGSLQETEAVKEYIKNVQRYAVPITKKAEEKAAEDSKEVKAPKKVTVVKK